MSLRDYQSKCISDIEADPNRKVLVVAPTGAGKTVIATDLMKGYADRGKRSLFIVHRREIVHQTSAKLRDLGVGHGIIMAGEPDSWYYPTRVAAIQTLHARAVRGKRIEMPRADLVIFDEAHHCPAKTYEDVIAAFPEARIIGFTATPCRGDGRGLGGIFESMIELPQVPDMIDQGWLVGTRTYAPVRPDLRGIRVQAGDYAPGQLEVRMDTKQLVGDIVTHWLKYGEGRKTVVFASGVGHSIHIRDEFTGAGVRAEHIDGGTPKDERDAALDRLRRGDIDVISNCMVLTEGWDMPDIGCVVLARPTKQMGLYRQMLGRGLRPAPGKKDLIVLDHSGAVYRLGFVEDRVEWTLDPDSAAVNKTQAKRQEENGDRLVECKQCGSIRLGGLPCPACGYLPTRPAVSFETVDGDLGLVDRDRKAEQPPCDPGQWHAMLIAIGLEKGYKPGWAKHKYQEKFGRWPAWGSNPAPIEPSVEVRRWVRSRIIAYAKSREACR